jgi:hypothetical protein
MTTHHPTTLAIFNPKTTPTGNVIPITFSTCWYNFKPKFDKEIYMKWARNMLHTVENYYLVIYTDQPDLLEVLELKPNSKIRVQIKSADTFVTYKYYEHWIQNHERNDLLNENARFSVDWRVNMLWSEKVHFVAETKKSAFFPPTEFYGWCDIGYFRDIPNTPMWPNPVKIRGLNKDKIHYGCIQNNSNYLTALIRHINNKKEDGLPCEEIPPYQNSIAGGFWVAHADLIEDWRDTYDARLATYFAAGYLVKDDQIILADLIFSNMGKFLLYRENQPGLDNWFMFQRIFL